MKNVEMTVEGSILTIKVDRFLHQLHLDQDEDSAGEKQPRRKK